MDPSRRYAAMMERAARFAAMAAEAAPDEEAETAALAVLAEVPESHRREPPPSRRFPPAA